MKLMKHIMIALVLCAIPAMAFGQTVSCDNCTHQLSVYMGSGGFVATHDDDMDAEKVTWVASCNGITRHGELEPGTDGMVAALLEGDLACHAEGGGSFRLGPITDGGWFWITDADNSAVGNLVALDLFDDEGMSVNGTVDITSAGDGVTMMAGKGAVYLKEPATGRVGILPNILPEPMMEPEADVKCGPRRSAAPPFAYTWQLTNSCMLGGGRTKIRLVGPGAFGSSAMITDGMVYRPAAGTVTVTADLWVDESGSYSIATDNQAGDAPTVASIRKGWAGRGSENWLTATFAATANATVGNPVALPSAGVTLANNGGTSTNPDRRDAQDQSNPPPVGQAVLTIAPDPNYCSKTNNHTAVINITATPGDNAIHPAVATGKDAGLGSASWAADLAAITQLRVVCPPASAAANPGQELVPENPFPTDR